MSVIGISPTDIVKGAKALKDAATALTSGQEGAKQQFQDVHAALSSFEQAVTDLKRSTPSENPPDAVYTDLLERERRFQTSLQAYDRRLGPKSQARTWSTLKRKLQYAFDGEAKVQKHIITSKPGVDAALFNTMRAQKDLVTKNQEQMVQTVRDGIASVTARIGAVSPDMVASLSQALVSLPQEHSDAVKTALNAHWEDVKLDLSQVVHEAVVAGITNSAQEGFGVSSTRRNPHVDQKHYEQHAAAQDGFTNLQASSMIGSENSVVARKPCQRSINRHAHHVAAQISRDERSSVASRVTLCLLSISTAALYQNPSTRKALASCLSTYHGDPVSLTLLLLAVLAFTNCFVSLPLQVSLLTDNSIFLDTALGEPLKIPRHYWESFDIFHGFLTTHFATRPGQGYVKARKYRILLGGPTGQVLDFAKWNMVVSARMKLVMALLLEDSSNDCPKCLTALARRGNSLSYCPTCDNLYQSIDTDHWKGPLDNEDSEFFDNGLPVPGDDSSVSALSNGANVSHQNAGAGRSASRFVTVPRPEELQCFVHMLLSKIVHSNVPLDPRRSPVARGSIEEDLDLVAETLRVCVQDWQGLDNEIFGSLHMCGVAKVGKPGVTGTQVLTCYLFEQNLILTKERSGPKWPTIPFRDYEVNRCSLKGSILFREHLKSLQEMEIVDRQDLVLRLHLNVAELPAIDLHFEDEAERQRWLTAIGDLAFGPNWHEEDSMKEKGSTEVGRGRADRDE